MRGRIEARKKVLTSVLSVVLISSLMLPTAAFGEGSAEGPGGGSAEETGFSPLADFSDTGSPVAPVSLVATPVDLLDGSVANYLLLEVKDASYASATYYLDGGAVTPTPVLTDANIVKYIKVPVPAAATSGELKVSLGGTDYTGAYTAATAGVVAPSVLYGTTSMDFSEYYYDVTADITTVEPATTAFTTGGTVETPANFITGGTRAQWPAQDALPKIDVISSATYGDAVHFIPTGNYILNYDPSTTQGAGHEVQGIKTVDVAISVDLLANATLLNQASPSLATAQSTAVVDKVGDVSGAEVSVIYKPKHLQIDGNWGARATTAVTAAAAAAWPGGPLTTAASYGGNFTNREVTFTFTGLPTNLTENSAALLWDNYLNNIYGGYVEGPTGHREPLVWLQNLFTHKAHTNFEVSINQDVFSRFASLGLPGDLKIVVYAKGLQDIEAVVPLLAVADNNASIEQGTTFYVKQGDASTYFEGNELHIGNLSASTLAAFDSANARITKGGVALDSSLYSLDVDGSEVAATFSDAFFTSPTVGGAYVITVIPTDTSTWYKTFSFTVNLLVDRPTLAINGIGAFAATEASPVTAALGKTLTFSNEAYAKAISVSARGGSTITDVTPIGATTAPAIGSVLKLSGATGSAYTIDTTDLTLGHTYRLNIITSGFATDNGTAKSTTTQYFITLGEESGGTGGTGGTGGSGSGGTGGTGSGGSGSGTGAGSGSGDSGLPKTGDTSLPLAFTSLGLLGAAGVAFRLRRRFLG
jgi:hypothetical protein